MSIANPVILSWDGPGRRIYLKQGVTAFHWITDIYIEYRRARRLETDDLRKYNPFMLASGNEPKGGGKATPRLLKLLEDVKVILWDEAGEVAVTGEAITDNADIDPTLFDNSTRTFPLIINYAPPAAEVIVVDAIAKALDYGGKLTYDENSSNSGQDHPVGTHAVPVNNIEDGIAICIKYGLHSVHTHSNIHLDRDVEGFNMEGAIPNLIFYTHGFKAHLCKFEEIKISGDFNNSLIKVKGCYVMEALNVYGAIDDSYLGGRVLIAAGQNLNLDNSQSGIPGLDSPEIDMNAGNDTTLSLRVYSGGMTITNCDTPDCIATLSFSDGGKPHLEPSCTDGLLSVRGIGHMDDRSAGTVVEDSAFFDPADIQFLRDVMEGDMVPTETEWKILQKTTKAILVHKNTNVVGELTQLIEP